jgi:hypothetical protein
VALWSGVRARPSASHARRDMNEQNSLRSTLWPATREFLIHILTASAVMVLISVVSLGISYLTAHIGMASTVTAVLSHIDIVLTVCNVLFFAFATFAATFRFFMSAYSALKLSQKAEP